MTHSNNLLDEELITEELRMEEREEKNEVMEVGLYTVRREAVSKGDLGGWQWTRTGFNPDPGLSVVKGTHHREYLVSSRVHGAEIMVSRTHNDFSKLHQALQTRLRGKYSMLKIKDFRLRYWRLGIVLPPAPEPLNHPRAPLQGVLNILRRINPHSHPGERK